MLESGGSRGRKKSESTAPWVSSEEKEGGDLING